MEKITESKALVAIFMDDQLELLPSGKGVGKKRGYPKQYENWYSIRYWDDINYDRYWNALMPVGKKCFDISQNQDRPNVNACNKLDFIECEIGMHVREYNLVEAYNKIVEFITIYNTNHPNNGR